MWRSQKRHAEADVSGAKRIRQRMPPCILTAIVFPQLFQMHDFDKLLVTSLKRFLEPVRDP